MTSTPDSQSHVDFSADYGSDADSTAAPAPVIPSMTQVLEVMEELWPASLAESWDASGPVAGRPEKPVARIHWAVDPVQQVADEAVRIGADLLITHHPLFLRPVNSVYAAGFKARVVTTLLQADCGLITAHTNGDSAVGGVSDVIAEILGLENLRPLAPAETGAADGLPEEGIGRVGELPKAMRLEEFAGRVFTALPAVAGGVRVAGDRNGLVHTVAVCGGAGDSLFDQVRAAQADVYVTADLRHHPASEAREHAVHNYGNPNGDRPYLVDVSHFASEWLWLPAAAQSLDRALADRGFTVESSVSAINTDPWDFVLTAPADQGTQIEG